MNLRHLTIVTTSLLIGILRGRAITTFLVATVIPSAIITVFLLAVDILNTQTNMITAMYRGKPSLIYVEKPLGNISCVRVRIENVLVKTVNESFETQVHVVDNFTKYVELNHLRITKSSKTVSGEIVSVGWLLAEKYGLKPGSEITVCIGRDCYSTNITRIHIGSRCFGYIIIVSRHRSLFGKSGFLCRVKDNWILESIVEDLVSSTKYTMGFLSLFTLLAYAPILYLAHNKALTLIRRDLRILYSIGVSRTHLRLGFILATTLLSIVLVLYGVSIGTLLIHISTWILRFFGIIILEKPVLAPEALASIITPLTIASLIVAGIVSGRIGDAWWNGL